MAVTAVPASTQVSFADSGNVAMFQAKYPELSFEGALALVSLLRLNHALGTIDTGTFGTSSFARLMQMKGQTPAPEEMTREEKIAVIDPAVQEAMELVEGLTPEEYQAVNDALFTATSQHIDELFAAVGTEDASPVPEECQPTAELAGAVTSSGEQPVQTASVALSEGSELVEAEAGQTAAVSSGKQQVQRAFTLSHKAFQAMILAQQVRNLDLLI
jgi:hypothetical protein